MPLTAAINEALINLANRGINSPDTRYRGIGSEQIGARQSCHGNLISSWSALNWLIFALPTQTSKTREMASPKWKSLPTANWSICKMDGVRVWVIPSSAPGKDLIKKFSSAKGAVKNRPKLITNLSQKFQSQSVLEFEELTARWKLNFHVFLPKGKSVRSCFLGSVGIKNVSWCR